jgi:RNA polymerase sigma factor (sigma-70 family)
VDSLAADPEGFDDAFPQLHNAAYQAAYRILGNRAEAEEVAQETLARCLVRWRRVAAYAEAWVTRSAANLAIDVYRHRTKAPPATRSDPAAGHDHLVELRADLVRALRSLSRRQRDVVVMRYLVELPERDVARLLGCSEGSVKRHASRGLAALRREMGIELEPGLGSGDDAEVGDGTGSPPDPPAPKGRRKGRAR